MTKSESLLPVPQVLDMPTADTEYELVLPVGTKHFSLKFRDAATVGRLAATTGLVAGSTDPYVTLHAGQPYTSPEKVSWSGTLYVASSSASQTLEVFVWTHNNP